MKAKRVQLKEFDLFVPLVSEENGRMSARQLNRLKKELINRFGGLTHFTQKNKGIWKIGTTEFRDEIIILRVLAPDSNEIKTFWRDLKIRLEREWKQKEILIIARDVELV